MNPRGLMVASVLGALLSAATTPAWGVINVDLPVARIYQEAKVVAVGTVVAVNPDNRVVEVKLDDTPKGKLPADRLRVQCANPATLIKDVAEGTRLVIFTGEDEGKPVAVIHLADTWLLAQPIPQADPPAWRVGQVHDIKQSFPGRTQALVRIVAALKAGKYPLLDVLPGCAFRGGVRELAKLNVARPRFLCALDADGDKKPDLLVGAPGGVRLFLSAGEGFKDATEACGLAGADGAFAAAADADGDGRCDLLLGGTLWLNQGGRFIRAKPGPALPEGAQPIAGALADATGDRKPDAVVLLADGRLVTLENPGAPDRPWRRRSARPLWKGAPAPVAAAFGDFSDEGAPDLMLVRPEGLTRHPVRADAGPPADEDRLMGKSLAAQYKVHPAGLKNASAGALDVNADKRPDLLVVGEGVVVLLVARGFGAYLVHLGGPETLLPPGASPAPFRLGPTTPWAAADIQGDGWDDLLVITEDGRLFALTNAPPPARP